MKMTFEIIRRRNITQRILVLVVLIAFVVSWAGWERAPAFAEEKIVRIALATKLRNFDPHKTIATHERAVQQNIFDTLTELDRNYRPVPSLAVSWKYLNDTTLEVKLRRGVKFHNGQPFTSDDVVFTYDRILKSKPAVRIFSWIRGTMKNVEKVDDFTVRITTPRTYAPLLANLTRFHILPAKAFKEMGEKKFARNPVGTGPFQFVSWTVGQKTVLKAFKGHWRKGIPKVDGAEFRIIPDEFGRFAALKAGEVDIVQNLPAARISAAKKDSNITVKSVWGQRNMWLGLMINPPLDNVLVRRALNYAVDKDAIRKNIFGGNAGKVAPGGFGALAFGHHDDIPHYPYDPKKAKELLAQAGYPKGLELDFRCSSNRYASDREVCQAIQGQLAAVGVKTNLQFTEWAVYSKMRKQKSMKNIYFLGYGNSLFDADFPLRLCCWGGGRSETKFNTPELDKMIVEASTILDKKKRYDLYGKIQRYIRDSATYLFLYDQYDIYGIRSRVKWEPWATELIPLHEVEIIR